MAGIAKMQEHFSACYAVRLRGNNDTRVVRAAQASGRSVMASDELARRLGQRRVLEREVQRRLDQAELATAVEARAFEAIGEHALLGQQRGNRIGQLDLA